MKTLIEQTLAQQGYPLTLNLVSAPAPALTRLAEPGRIEVSIPSLSQASLLLPSNKLNLPPVLEPAQGPPGGGP